MRVEQVFVGHILKCTKYNRISSLDLCAENELNESNSFGYIETDFTLYKSNAILIKLSNGGYVDLDRINSIFDYIKINGNSLINKYKLDGLVMPTYAYEIGNLYIDKKSLIPYYNEQKNRKVLVKKLKKDILLDSRIPGGIEN